MESAGPRIKKMDVINSLYPLRRNLCQVPLFNIKILTLSYIDVILTTAIIICTGVGYRMGFINSFSGIIKWAGAFTIALLFYPSASFIIENSFSVQAEWLLPLSFLIIFSFSFSLLSITLLFFKKCFKNSVQESYTNHVAGIIPGFFTGIIAATIISKILASSLWVQAADETEKSLLSASLEYPSTTVSAELNTIFNISVDQKISGAFESGPGTNEMNEFSCHDFNSRPDLEDRLLQLVNEERIKYGLKMLIADTPMKKAAFSHASDMFTRGYFAHHTPEGTDPFERMNKLSINFIFAGENLAHSSNLLSAHKGLMKSPGHRANILNPAFGKIGISILDGGAKGLMIVQEFRD